jgi:periplasmic divalent cation tolerance protein
MSKAERIVVFITAGSEEEAHRIAELLVRERKAACVNIVPRVESVFEWEGKLELARESLLIAKTRASLFPELVAAVKGAHNYELPEIIALPIVAGNEDYLQWLDGICR